MNPTEQAHRSLNGLLLNGRILVNGLPLTAQELSNVLQQEQLLFEKAAQFDKAQALVAAKAKEKADKTPKKKD
jgi:hypothetical protein